MRVLVTGGTGLIGRSLVERLAPQHEVFAVARGEPPADTEGVHWIQHDLSREFDSADLPDSVDAVAHLAQSDRYRDFPDGAVDIFEVNVHSTFRLLRYAHAAGVKSFVLASTGGLYARSPEPISESAPIPAPGPYFRSKRMAELLVEDHAELFAGVVLRFFFVYGSGPSPMLFARLARRILAGEEIQIEGDPGMRMNPLFVDDAVAAIEAALGVRKSATVNVAGGEIVDLADIVARLGTALGRDPRITHLRDRQAGDMVADTTRMWELLGVRANTGLDKGLAVLAHSLAGQVT